MHGVRAREVDSGVPVGDRRQVVAERPWVDPAAGDVAEVSV